MALRNKFDRIKLAASWRKKMNMDKNEAMKVIVTLSIGNELGI